MLGDVRGIMQKGDDGATFPDIVDITTNHEIESNCMMEDHFNEIIGSIKGYMAEHLACMIAGANEIIFL